DGIAHKADVGGVILGVGDERTLREAIATIRDNVAARKPGVAVDRVLVQPMIAGVGEVLIGYRVDADVGPLVMLAAGGALTEIHRDRALPLAPVDLDQPPALIADLPTLPAPTR